MYLVLTSWLYEINVEEKSSPYSFLSFFGGNKHLDLLNQTEMRLTWQAGG